MREIKFRGRAITGIWVYGGIAIKSHGAFINDENMPYDDCCKVVPQTVNQFTGLHDKNGKEIFEGDIVEVEDYVAVIEWDIETCRFVLNIHGENLVYDFDNFYGKELEVIGNIYDNPELLEANNEGN